MGWEDVDDAFSVTWMRNTWKNTVDGGLEGLPVDIGKVAGDQGKAIVSQAVKELDMERPDGSTAAERLPVPKPKDMFKYLLNSIGLPVRLR